MKKLLGFLALALVWASAADAATCFWRGGTGSWSDATHWSSSSGGSGSTCAASGGVPTTGDTATFDGSSGGGTVTIDTSFTVATLTWGAFTGTIDFSANNNSPTITFSFNGSGSGTRTFNCGTGTFTLSGTANAWNIATTTGLTLSCASATLSFTATGQKLFQGGGKSYGTISVGAYSGSGYFSISGANTIATFNVTAPNALQFPNGVTTTITNAFTWTGTSASQIYVVSGAFSQVATVSVSSGSPTMTFAGVRDMTFSGGATFTATSSFNLGNNTGITITAPSSGGGFIIGG